ncbi:MAG: sulfatase [Opitutales bacterium]|nr:sulfatase [Opitutales bacterium]
MKVPFSKLIRISLACLALGNPLLAQQTGTEDARPNVLMIIIDDLNDWVSHMGGHPQLQTPNIDSIADAGVSFTNAHTMAPQCHPSRRAFFSGNPPFVSEIYNNGDRFKDQDHLVNQSLFRYFRQNGYYVVGAGKIIGGEESEDATDYFQSKGPRPKVEMLLESGETAGQSWGILPETVEGYNAVEDEPTVKLMEEVLAEDLVTKHDKPFFVIAGLYKPHLPFYVPQRFFDMHPLDEVLLPEINDNDRADLDEEAFCLLTRCNDNNTFGATDQEMRELVRAYLACSSYTDYNVGRILEAFENGPNSDRETIIILWSDHGYHLGEKQLAAKRTLWNESTRAPYIWVVPGKTPAGKQCSQPVDFSTTYTTLCELAGLPTPEWVSNRKSISPLLETPHCGKWDGVAVTTYMADNHTIVADGYRLIRYSINAPSSWELYDECEDQSEWTNLLFGRLETMEDLENSSDPIIQKAAELDYKLQAYLDEMKQSG